MDRRLAIGGLAATAAFVVTVVTRAVAHGRAVERMTGAATYRELFAVQAEYQQTSRVLLVLSLVSLLVAGAALRLGRRPWGLWLVVAGAFVAWTVYGWWQTFARTGGGGGA